MSNLVRHKKTHRDKRKEFACSECGRQFRSTLNQNLVSHKRVHITSKYRCTRGVAEVLSRGPQMPFLHDGTSTADGWSTPMSPTDGMCTPQVFWCSWPQLFASWAGPWRMVYRPAGSLPDAADGGSIGQYIILITARDTSLHWTEVHPTNPTCTYSVSPSSPPRPPYHEDGEDDGVPWFHQERDGRNLMHWWHQTGIYYNCLFFKVIFIRDTLVK